MPTPFRWNGTDAQGQPLRWGAQGVTWNGAAPDPPPNPTPPKKMQPLHVLLDFAIAPDHDLEERAGAVIAKLYSTEGVAIYHTPAPPVDEATLTTARDAFHEALPLAENGSAEDVADKNEKREVLIGLLRKLAAYVETKHGDVLSDLLASGFEAQSTTRNTGPLEKPVIRRIKDGDSGQLLVTVNKVDRAASYEGQATPLAANGALGTPIGIPAQTSSRGIEVNGLEPGTQYQIHRSCISVSASRGALMVPPARRAR
jgi:hypothetical protein